MRNRSARNAYDKERYRYLKEHGVCVYCGKVDAMPGRSQCQSCLNANRERARKRMAKRRRRR